MRIYRKSDFDFRLDLYASDPYGKAVPAGFPEHDFSGILVTGPSTKALPGYTFSKKGNTLVNCYNDNGHIHVVVAHHSLLSGPLYCELTLNIPDETYPDGTRRAVHLFPLNIYLTDDNAEQISPVVSVPLPAIAVNSSEPTATEPANENLTISTFSREPWLANSVCKGHFRSGAFVGNVYRNEEGRMYLTGEEKLKENLSCIIIEIPKLERLASRSIDQIIRDLKTVSPWDAEGNIEIRDKALILYYSKKHRPGFYLPINPSPYITITPQGALLTLESSPLRDYRPKPYSLNEIMSLFKFVSRDTVKNAPMIRLQDSHRHFVLQVFSVCRKSCVSNKPNDDTPRWVKTKLPTRRWRNKKRISAMANVRTLFLRAARRNKATLSEWTYFKLMWDADHELPKFMLTDETGNMIAKTKLWQV